MIRQFLTGSILGCGLLGLACSGSGEPMTNTGGTSGSGAAAGVGGTGNPGVGGTGNPGVGGTGDPGAGGTGNPGAGGGNPGAGGGNPGAGGGNPGSGGGAPVEEPSLITSEKDNYWQVGEAAAGAAGPATLTVTAPATEHPWHGFGGTYNEAGWDALMALDEPDRNAIMQLLFDPVNGIGMDWGRIPIGPSDFALERYTLSNAPGEFDISHDEQYLIPYIEESMKYKAGMKFWGSPWTPPPWAKTGTTENDGYDKGYFDGTYYTEYANFFVAWVDAYEQKGIPIDHVMPQNEPGWAQSYPTCAFGPARDTVSSTDVYTSEPVTFGPFLKDYLKPALDATSHGTKVWFGTLSNDDTFTAYWDSLTDKSVIEGVALQWATQTRVGMLRNAGQLVMQSEHKCGNYPWLSAMATSRDDANRDNFLASMAPNNHAYGEESWDLMKSWIDDGVNIYSAWNLVLDIYGWNLDQVRPWPQNAMIAVNKDSKTYEVTAYYYVFRHVAQYVDVGASVMDINGNALAFKNPDGDTVVVVFNDGQTATTHTVDIDGALIEFSVPARGWATVNYRG